MGKEKRERRKQVSSRTRRKRQRTETNIQVVSSRSRRGGRTESATNSRTSKSALFSAVLVLVLVASLPSPRPLYNPLPSHFPPSLLHLPPLPTLQSTHLSIPQRSPKRVLPTGTLPVRMSRNPRLTDDLVSILPSSTPLVSWNVSGLLLLLLVLFLLEVLR